MTGTGWRRHAPWVLLAALTLTTLLLVNMQLWTAAANGIALIGAFIGAALLDLRHRWGRFATRIYRLRSEMRKVGEDLEGVRTALDGIIEDSNADQLRLYGILEAERMRSAERARELRSELSRTAERLEDLRQTLAHAPEESKIVDS